MSVCSSDKKSNEVHPKFFEVIFRFFIPNWQMQKPYLQEASSINMMGDAREGTYEECEMINEV